MSATEIG